MAADLELWQEAFRSIEDIHALMEMGKTPVKIQLMGNYFEKLARMYRVGDNYLFHAAAWLKYYSLVRQGKVLTEEEHTRLACFFNSLEFLLLQ